MDWPSLVVACVAAIGGPAVAVVALVLSFKERRAGLRQAVYEKQLEACERVLQAAVSLANKTFWIIREHTDREVSPETIPGVVNTETEQEYKRWHDTTFVCRAWLPQKVLDGVGLFYQAFARVSTGQCQGEDAVQLLGKAYTQLYTCIRARLGIEPLADETSKMIGSVKPPKVG